MFVLIFFRGRGRPESAKVRSTQHGRFFTNGEKKVIFDFQKKKGTARLEKISFLFIFASSINNQSPC